MKLKLDYQVKYSNCNDGQVQLSNGTNAMEGRVEICYNHVWFGICINDWYVYSDQQRFAGAVCNDLGYSNSKNFFV